MGGCGEKKYPTGHSHSQRRVYTLQYKEKLEAVGCGPENTGLTVVNKYTQTQRDNTGVSSIFFIDFN